MSPQICEAHRKGLLRFLLLNTAAVRSGVNPGKLPRVQHCYKMKKIIYAERLSFFAKSFTGLSPFKFSAMQVQLIKKNMCDIFNHCMDFESKDKEEYGRWIN